MLWRSSARAKTGSTITQHSSVGGGLLRGNYKQSEYGKVILPLTVLRRLDCVLEPTKAVVLEPHVGVAGCTLAGGTESFCLPCEIALTPSFHAQTRY